MTGGTHLSGETNEERVPQVRQGEGKVLIEEVDEEFTHAVVRPPAMYEQ